MHSSFDTRQWHLSLRQYFFGHKHCYLCRQASLDIICSCCLSDTALPHFAVPGFDLIHHPSIVENIVYPYFNHLYALGEYKGILRQLITELKFANKPLCAEVLATLFVHFTYTRMSQLDDLPDALVPTPLSAWRYAQRGYNQARLLTQALSRFTDIPIIEPLKRARHTQAQSQLDKTDRLANMENAFCLVDDIDCDHIAVIDDVLTTGATVNSACKAIVSAYPDIRISVWSMAVTPLTKPEILKSAYSSGDI
jgi:ComF family protein